VYRLSSLPLLGLNSFNFLSSAHHFGSGSDRDTYEGCRFEGNGDKKPKYYMRGHIYISKSTAVEIEELVFGDYTKSYILMIASFLHRVFKV